MSAADDRAAYDATPGENWSRVKLLEKSPAHYRQGFGDDSSGFALGTAAHMAILEPERFLAEYVVFTGKVRNGKVWDAFEQAAIDAGKSVLNQKEYNNTLAIRDAVRGNAKAMEYLSGGEPEVTLTWKLGDFSCKGRADYRGIAIADLKSTKDCSPRKFGRACLEYGYFGQAAWYSDGNFLATGKRLPFRIIAVESSPPHLVTVYRVTDEQLAYGREQYLSLLGKLDYCRKNNFWGGYTEEDELDLVMPEYARTENA